MKLYVFNQKLYNNYIYTYHIYNMEKQINDIDIVITWVDGNDPEWLRERAKYVESKVLSDKSTGGAERYEDTDLLQYLFRGIEKFVPWVRKIHFVTWGHLPKWLNTSNPKLHIVNHKDFIPAEFLPTYNSATINLNLHRIPDLAEKFIYFNDDMFLLKETPSTIFFKKDLPCDMAVQDVVETYCYHDNYYYTVVNDLCLTNHICSKRDLKRKHFSKYYNCKYGFKNNIKNFFLSRFSLFTGFVEPHSPAAYLKSSFNKVWDLIGDDFRKACFDKTRTHFTCTENVIRYYQMGTGKFVPINREKYGVYTTMSQKNLSSIIEKQKFNLLCINYSDKNSLEKIRQSFNTILGEKSSFEK